MIMLIESLRHSEADISVSFPLKGFDLEKAWLSSRFLSNQVTIQNQFGEIRESIFP